MQMQGEKLFPTIDGMWAEQLADAIGGELRLAEMPPRDGRCAPVGRIVSDSRLIESGDVFWAMRGENCDGAEFAYEAMMRGADGVISERPMEPWAGRWSIRVADATVALWELARWRRSAFSGAAIAVTGSVGKTTTRQMIDAVLRRKFIGTASPRNFNNHVGLPLSMLAIEPNDDYAVLELGANRPGEIGALAQLCRPQTAVITRVADAHLGTFGGPQAVLDAKIELLATLPSDGWAVLPGDDPRMRRVAEATRANVVRFGRGGHCDVMATGVECTNGTLSFRIDGAPICVPVWGRHYLDCALAAFAVGRIFEMSAEEIAEALTSFEPPPMRCAVSEIGGVTIIDDTYNASPAAVQAALELLAEFRSRGRHVFVCGDMRELGGDASPLHRRVGDQVVALCGADMLVACGDHAGEMVDAARKAGMPSHCAIACRFPEDAADALAERLEPGDVVLIKGSRALSMERVVERLRNRALRRAA